jgi:glycosyltransferase involved in cell wall biosynthesis
MAMNSEAAPILFLLGTLEIGGSETKFVALASRLRRAGWPVHVAYLREPADLLGRLKDVPCVHLRQTGKWSKKSYHRLREYVAVNGIRSVVTVNPYPLTYAVTGRYDDADPQPRIIASINTSEFLSFRDRLFMLLYSRLLRRCDAVVFGSQRQMNSWITRYGLNKQKACVIYNGVDSRHFSPVAIPESNEEIRKTLGIPIDSFVIVCVGQFRPEKAHGNLLQAFYRYLRKAGRRCDLVLVGDGSERNSIETSIVQLDISENVHLVGAVSDVRPYLKAANLFALTSVAVETFSNAALEAASMHLPIVLSDVGGAPEMFPNLSDCTIYEKDDINALSDAIARYADGGTAPASRHDRLRSVVERKYSTAAMDEAWRRVIWDTPGMAE